jgi:hypothetical protein
MVNYFSLERSILIKEQLYFYMLDIIKLFYSSLPSWPDTNTLCTVVDYGNFSKSSSLSPKSGHQCPKAYITYQIHFRACKKQVKNTLTGHQIVSNKNANDTDFLPRITVRTQQLSLIKSITEHTRDIREWSTKDIFCPKRGKDRKMCITVRGALQLLFST